MRGMILYTDEMKEMAAVGMHADLKLHLQVDDQNRGLCKT
jgi:hypothetical protein